VYRFWTSELRNGVPNENIEKKPGFCKQSHCVLGNFRGLLPEIRIWQVIVDI
jgi:hypothetical protein